ncbi:NGO_0222 family membrane protein, partial [Campylobacter showae]|uniref:NGO_0222 family membrane protein n=1 Tax=Campylobacter showae TaxID=204 RepID=UPI0034C6D91F
MMPMPLFRRPPEPPNPVTTMTKRRTFLILTVLFTLLFIALVTLGAYLLSIQSKQFAVAAFLFAFGAVFGQVGSLA